MTSVASFNKRALSLSSPIALFVLKDLRALWIKLILTSFRWNSDGRVLEVGVDEIFRNDLSFTNRHKVLVHDPCKK